MTDKAPRTRKSHTPAQRAQEQVDVLRRREGKIATAKAALEAKARDLAPELEAVRARLTYAEASPDLPKITDAKAPNS